MRTLFQPRLASSRLSHTWWRKKCLLKVNTSGLAQWIFIYQQGDGALFRPREGHPGKQAYTFLIRITLISLISVKIFCFCYFFRNVLLWIKASNLFPNAVLLHCKYVDEKLCQPNILKDQWDGTLFHHVDKVNPTSSDDDE